MMVDYGAPNVLWLEYVGGPLNGRRRPAHTLPPMRHTKPERHTANGTLGIYVWDPVSEVWRCRYEEPVQEAAA